VRHFGGRKFEKIHDITAKLCAERLAREATHGKPVSGHIDPKEIERGFPHIVEMYEMYAWHWARDLEAMRGRGWRDENGRFYVRWCFANLITARDFARKFGGPLVKGRER
jgi:hypothetical protein